MNLDDDEEKDDKYKWDPEKHDKDVLAWKRSIDPEFAKVYNEFMSRKDISYNEDDMQAYISNADFYDEF